MEKSNPRPFCEPSHDSSQKTCAGFWPQYLARGPGVCCPIRSRHRGQQNQLLALNPTPCVFPELCVWLSRGSPVPQWDAGALPIAHYAQNGELNCMKGSHTPGNFGYGQHGLQPCKSDAALQSARATEDSLLHPTKCLFPFP